MDVKNLNQVPAFLTKDGLEIRELLAHRNSAVRHQSLAEARVPVGGSTLEHYHAKAEEIYYITAGTGRMRIDVQAGGKHIFTEAFDGDRGWEWTGKGDPQPASEKGALALRHGVELPGKLFGLHEIKQRGHRIELLPREKIDGIDYYALRLILSDGYTTTLYVDPQSWLITRRRDVRPLHVDVDPTPTTIEQRSSDFRDVSGVKFAFATSEIDLKTGKQLESTKISSIKVNPLLDESIFKKL